MPTGGPRRPTTGHSEAEAALDLRGKVPKNCKLEVSALGRELAGQL